ncbi:hypothetical protein KAM334_33620 [Aeromonas caviae]|nr:hypothetical protein KAM334_33620 [Aeromonas caviae]
MKTQNLQPEVVQTKPRSMTIGGDEQTIKCLYCYTLYPIPYTHHGHWGHGFRYSDIVIDTLMLKAIASTERFHQIRSSR